MELQDAIRLRRSVRKFDSSKKVKDEDILKILDAGHLAPSSGNSQCWHFIVVTNPDIKKELSTKAGHQAFIKDASAVIVVCADLEISSAYGNRGIQTYSLQDTAAAIENMLLTVTELGLATCWIGAFDEKNAHNILGLKEKLRTIAMLPIGYANENPQMPKRKPIEIITQWLK